MSFPSRPYAAPSPGLSVLSVTVLLNVAVFFLQSFGPPTASSPGVLSHERLANGEWWTVLTHLFMHDGVFHLVSNMLLLVACGRRVQQVFGPQHFCYIYLFSAWAGAALSLVSQNSQIVGASGGVMGILGAWCAIHADDDILRPWVKWKFRGPRGRYLWAGLVLSSLILEGVQRLAPAQLTGTAHLLHAAALVTGWYYAMSAPGRPEPDSGMADFIAALQAQRSERQLRKTVPDQDQQDFFNEEEELDAAESPPEPATMSDTLFMRECVDPILEKIHHSGRDSLSAEDRATLAEAARRMDRRKHT